MDDFHEPRCHFMRRVVLESLIPLFRQKPPNSFILCVLCHLLMTYFYELTSYTLVRVLVALVDYSRVEFLHHDPTALFLAHMAFHYESDLVTFPFV